uniref:N-acetylgalactosaminide beta-1,3-galactosyltransferase n=1 Tax=Leptobrachium leishanense TaxID=445787 RepID=A0A8C5P6C9_9ANUR
MTAIQCSWLIAGCGFCVGFLSTFYLASSVMKVREPHVQEASWKYKNIEIPTISNNDHLSKDLSRKVRVLCWIMTAPANLDTRTIHLKYSWTRHCNIALFMSSVTNESFPTIGLGTKEGRDQLYRKTIRAFQIVHKHYYEKADWFLRADDDTYIVVENLRWMLSNYTPDQPVYFGKRFKPFAEQGYMSGGAGFVLSKEALNRFVEGFQKENCTHTTSLEDIGLGQCMEKMGVIAGDSRDTEQRETFHPFTPDYHIKEGFDKSFWYWRYSYYPIVEASSLMIISKMYGFETLQKLLSFFSPFY